MGLGEPMGLQEGGCGGEQPLGEPLENGVRHIYHRPVVSQVLSEMWFQSYMVETLDKRRAPVRDGNGNRDTKERFFPCLPTIEKAVFNGGDKSGSIATVTIPAPIWAPEPEGSTSVGDLELIESSLILETEA